MSKKTQPQLPVSGILQTSLPHSFVVVHPNAVESIFFNNNSFSWFANWPLRERLYKYENSKDDIYHDSTVDFHITIWKHVSTGQKFIYVDHTGRLYTCWELPEMFEIFNYLMAKEISKIVPSGK